MDNVCNRCLFSIPSKVEMAEEQEYLRRSYFRTTLEKLLPPRKIGTPDRRLRPA